MPDVLSMFLSLLLTVKFVLFELKFVNLIFLNFLQFASVIAYGLHKKAPLDMNLGTMNTNI